MPGNSWYAYGNELLDEMVMRYAAGHPKTRTFSLAYSVWGETGMGARMGSVNHLAKMGVMPISTAAGVDHFLRLVDSGPEASRIVVTSRLGGLDTWAPAAPALPAVSRYIDQVVTFEPQVELVTRTTLSTSQILLSSTMSGKDRRCFRRCSDSRRCRRRRPMSPDA